MRSRTVLRLIPLLLAAALAACDREPAPRRAAPPAPNFVQIARLPGLPALESSDDLLTGRPLVTLDDGGTPVPAAARAWSHDAARGRWTFEVADALAWENRWPAGARARAEGGTLVVEPAPDDPDLLLRLAAFAPLENGAYAPPTRVGRSWSYAPRAGGPALYMTETQDERAAVLDFQRRQLDRVDGVSPGLSRIPEFRLLDAAETLVLLVELPEADVREAIAAEVLPGDRRGELCRRALRDPSRAARRIAPPPLQLPEPAARPDGAAGGRLPASLAVGDDGAPDSAALAREIRRALQRAGCDAAEPAPGEPARVRVVRLTAGSRAPAPFFLALRPLAASHPRLEPLFDALASAHDPAERVQWLLAIETALLDGRIVIPLARGVLCSLVRPGCPLDMDAFGRYSVRPAAAAR